MLYPMFAMVALTFLIGVYTLVVRVRNVKNGQLSIKYFTLMQADSVPVKVQQTTRCFNNLFEMPVLFYVAASLYISMGVHDSISVMLAWAFVFFRVLQAAVHLTYNNVMHRMMVFWLSGFAILGLWVNLITLQS